MSRIPAGYRFLVAIAIAFVLGLLVGYGLLYLPSDVRGSVVPWLKAFGDIFVRLIRVVIPVLIFFTIAAATASIASARRLGKILAWMLVLYIATSLMAATWGLLIGLVVKPGEGVGLTPPAEYKPPSPPSGVDILLSFFQLDFYNLLAVGGSMTMIIFAILLGLGVVLFMGETTKVVANYLKIGSSVMISVVRVIMYYAPVAVFCYAAWLIAVYGPQMLGAYAKFLGAQYGVSLLHFFVIYSIIVVLGGLSPAKYFKAQTTPF